MRLAFVVFLLVALLGTSQAEKCNSYCPRSLPTIVVPNIGSTYVYSLEAKTVLTPHDSQKVTIKADAEVSIQSVCQSVLQLKNVVIEGVANGAELAAQVALNPFGFGYFNGKVREVCPTTDEEEWVTNIKKAVVSTLQLSKAASNGSAIEEEHDFAGNCLTTFTRLETSANGMVIEKKKDLNKCSDRRVDLRQTPDQLLYQVKELIRQNLHLFDSELTCKISINDKVIKDVDCEDSSTLFYRPNKPIQMSTIKMSLRETKAGVVAGFAERDVKQQAIFLAHQHKHDHTSTEADVVAVLKDLCAAISNPTASIEASTLTAKLVNSLKYLPLDAANSVDEAVKSGSICPAASQRLRLVFLDACVAAASDTSIKIFVKAHDNNEFSLTRAAAAFSVIAIKAAPNEETIRSLLPLVQSDRTTRPLLIGFSVLTRRYCEKKNDCETNTATQEARDAFVKRIGETTDPKTKITLIKALENLNVNKNANENLIKLLDEMANSAETDDAIRLAAVKAMPNDASINEHLRSIVLKEANPNEVRIAAFQKLVHNKGLGDVAPLMSVQEHCVKNYILSYLKNLKNAKNPVRRSLIPDGVALTEEPKEKLGITRNIVFDNGPYTIEVDIIYPKDSNVTRSITTRFSRVKGDQLIEVAEISARQVGLDKNVGNVLNLLSNKISPHQFSFEAMKHLSEVIAKYKQKDHTHNHLQISGRINGKNVYFSDVFEDMHTIVGLVKQQIEKVITEKKFDRALASVLVDSKLIVPTVSGIPIIYKLSDNFLLQTNGEVTTNGNKRNVILNHSHIGGIHASAKLKLKDQKIGYEYDAKFAYTPKIDVDVEKKDKSIVLQFNMKEDKYMVFKLKQTLKEIKMTGTEVQSENELASEPRSDSCLQPFILKYCRKASHVKGLILNNVEYYVGKPDPAITGIQIELEAESPDATSKRFAMRANAMGSPTSLEHFAQFEVAYPKDAPKVLKMQLRSPDNSFETKFELNPDQSRNLNVKLNLPHLVEMNVNSKFEKEKETNNMKSDLLIDYKFPSDPTTHTLKIKNLLGYNLKRSGKDKVANLDWDYNLQSSRRPYLNHHAVVQFKYRPYKVNDLVLEFSYGKDFEHVNKFSRISMMVVQEMRPFKMTAQTDLNIVSTDLDVDYEFKSEKRILNDKGNALEFDLKLKGKDRSKRAAGTDNDIVGKIEYRNKGSSVDSKLEASFKGMGRDVAMSNELKQVEPQKYEGKIMIQTEKDKKIFITHKGEASKPTKEINLKTEGEITYSFKPDKKTFKFSANKQDASYVLKGHVEKDGVAVFSTDFNFDSSNGRLKAQLMRDTRSYDLTVDHVLKMREATLLFKNEDRHYNIKLKREPFKYINLDIDGNDQAYIKKGEAHISIIDPTKFSLHTKANTKIDMSLDVFSADNKKAALMIDSPKFNFFHEGDIDLSVMNPRMLWKSNTKKDQREYKFSADIARKGSLITLQKIRPEKTENLKYSRNGDRVEIDIDTEFVVGKIEGSNLDGKITLKNQANDYELESTYKRVYGELRIKTVSNKNAKLEGLISRIQPSKLVFETPTTKANLNFDLSTPIKTLKLDFDNPHLVRKIDAHMERGKSFKYSSYGKMKASNKERKIEVNGIPMRELNAEFDYPDFKFKVKQPEASKKVEFSYTYNNYTESEEFDFDPHRAYFINWLSALRKYAQTFIVQ